MQRVLVLIRHAKALKETLTITDFDRPLAEKGMEDAIKVGSILRKNNIIPNLIIASSAKRTEQTAKLIAASNGYKNEDIILKEKLYQSDTALYCDIIGELPTEKKIVFIIGHNPGITDFINQLDAKFRIDNMPTCGFVAVKISSDNWGQFSLANNKVFLFQQP